MTDEDDTPPIRLVTDELLEKHYNEYEPGTPIVQERPMSRDFAGHEAHSWQRRLEVEIEALQREVASLAASRSSTRKILWLVVPALATGIVSALIYAGDKIATSAERVGKTEARLDAYKERIDQQEVEIGQLRSALMRLSGGDRHQPTSDQVQAPDKYVLLDQRGGAGGISPQRPKLHTPQPFCGRIWHSVLLEQMSPHSRGLIPNWIANNSSSVGGGSAGDVASIEAVLHDATNTTTTKASFLIPEM